MDDKQALAQRLQRKIVQQRVLNKALEGICQALEKYCLYGTLENVKNETELKYKQLQQKQLSAEEEKQMEQKIQKKLGGIDAILQKAVKLHPGIFSDQDQLASAADVTKMKTTQIIEESKQAKPEKNDLSSVFLKQLKKTGQLDSTKPILRKIKEEVKTLTRKREAAKHAAMKAIKLQLKQKQSKAKWVPDKTFESFN